MAIRASGYSVAGYGDMITCEPRMSAYAEALRRAVAPGCTVIDIGAGTGIFSLLACKYGAGRVFAIEPHDSIDLLPRFAEANGCADRITVFKGLSTDFSATQKGDVIVSDIRGVLPLYEGHIPAIADARERLLKPGGTLIPSRDTLWVALVCGGSKFQPREEPWLRNDFELDLSAGYLFAANSTSKVDLESGDVLSAVAKLAVLDYNKISSPDVRGGFDLLATRAGTAHGLLVWFDTELVDGVGFSNAPGEPPLIYSQMLFPFERALNVHCGDRVAGEIQARLTDGNYVWTWRTTFERQGSNERLEFRQSTFLANVMAPDKLRTRASTFAPPKRPAHDVDIYCLSLFDGSRTLQQLADAVVEHFPDAFSNSQAALDHVTRLAGWYEGGRGTG